MSRNNATFVTSQQIKFLKEMDKWLSNEPWQSEVEIKTAMEVRTLIDKIEKKGYYYEDEAEFLNLMRSEYIEQKKKIKFIYTYKRYKNKNG
jgi:DNA-directed RNA polymerase specialized sigma54-like protein